MPPTMWLQLVINEVDWFIAALPVLCVLKSATVKKQAHYTCCTLFTPN